VGVKICCEYNILLVIIVFHPSQFQLRGVSKMTIMNYLRKMFRKSEPGPAVEYIRDEANASHHAAYAPASADQVHRQMDNEIDLSRRADLEGYARDINISTESIERWISSGLLMPEELKVAEKLVKIMRKHGG
jgi:hypothetical protein